MEEQAEVRVAMEALGELGESAPCSLAPFCIDFRLS